MTPLRKLRLDAGMSIPELARESGVGVATISGVERGASAYPQNLKALADCLAARLKRPVMASDLLVIEEPAA